MDINVFELAGILRDERITASSHVSDANHTNRKLDNITKKLCEFMNDREVEAFKIVALYRKPVDDLEK